MYALLHKKENRLLGFSYSGDQGEFSVYVEFKFELSDENVWNVPSFAEAEKARISHPGWYDTSYKMPINMFNSDDLEVIQCVRILEKGEK